MKNQKLIIKIEISTYNSQIVRRRKSKIKCQNRNFENMICNLNKKTNKQDSAYIKHREEWK